MEATWEKRLEQLSIVCDTASSPGNYDADPYHFGLANGLRLAMAIMCNDAVKYMDRPPHWNNQDYTFDQYQQDAAKTAVYPDCHCGFVEGFAPSQTNTGYRNDFALPYLAMKLNGEAGEVAELVAKAYRDAEGHFDAERCEKIIKESGDVLWYISEIARQLRRKLSVVAETNRLKLADRAARGVIKGSGSDR